MKTVRTLLMITAAVVLWIQQLAAADLVRLHSRYLGDGILEYVLEFPDERYFDKVNFDVLHVGGLQDQAVSFLATPLDWAEVPQGWKHDPMFWESVPYRRTFRIQATTDAYRLSTAMISWAQHWHPWAAPEGAPNREATPPQELAYANFMCLAPCDPGEVDGSPPEHVSSVPGYPELRIESFVLGSDGGSLVGLTCEVGMGLPVVVETSTDLKNWVAIGELVGSSGVTSWSTDHPFDQANHFLRIVVRR